MKLLVLLGNGHINICLSEKLKQSSRMSTAGGKVTHNSAIASSFHCIFMVRLGLNCRSNMALIEENWIDWHTSHKAL